MIDRWSEDVNIGGGLSEVAHDDSLEGKGTATEPLKAIKRDYLKYNDIRANNTTLAPHSWNAINIVGGGNISIPNAQKEGDIVTVVGRHDETTTINFNSVYRDNDKAYLTQRGEILTFVADSNLKWFVMEVFENLYRSVYTLSSNGTIKRNSFVFIIGGANFSIELAQRNGDYTKVINNQPYKIVTVNGTKIKPYGIMEFIYNNGWKPINSIGNDTQKYVSTNYGIDKSDVFERYILQSISNNATLHLPDADDAKQKRIVVNVKASWFYYAIVFDASVPTEYKMYDGWTYTFIAYNGAWILVEKHEPCPIQAQKNMYHPIMSNLNVKYLFNPIADESSGFMIRRDLSQTVGIINGVGVCGKCISLKGVSNKTRLSDRIYIDRRSFIISGWIKMTNDSGGQTKYFWGSSDSGNNNNTLHIGYRNDRTFRIGFYGNDVNFRVPTRLEYPNRKNKWTFFAVGHDTKTQETHLYIDGSYLGIKKHTKGQYNGYFNTINGWRSGGELDGFMSSLRVYNTWRDSNFNKDIHTILSEIYLFEKGLFIE